MGDEEEAVTEALVAVALAETAVSAVGDLGVEAWVGAAPTKQR